MRASVAAEKAGCRSVSIIATSFLPTAKTYGLAQGIRDIAVAEYPGVPMTDSPEELRAKVEQAVVGQIIQGFATPVYPVETSREPVPRDTVFEGTLDEVQEAFLRNSWSDGLPIIPPTVARVERFLRFTDRSPDEVIAVLPPVRREATVWNVAVHGVMAGCRPEYMPVLLAVVEAIADPVFMIEYGGSTPGWEPLIIVNGPIVKELQFNSAAGAMRVGRQANTSIGRFLRMFTRNIAGLRIPPGTLDKGTIGQSFYVALAEDEDTVADIGWQPFSVDQGFQAGDNVVTVQSVTGVSAPMYTAGDTGADHAQALAETWGQGNCAASAHTGMKFGQFYPLLIMSPSIARAVARSGWSKADFKQYLFEHVRTPAEQAERVARGGGHTDFSLEKLVAQGVLPPEYYESADPNRLVPVYIRPEWIGIVVAGDPGRNQSRGYIQNQRQGPPTSRKIELPARWEQLLSEARG